MLNPLNIRISVTSLTLSKSPGLYMERWRARKRKRTLEKEIEGGAEVMVTKEEEGR